MAAKEQSEMTQIEKPLLEQRKVFGAKIKNEFGSLSSLKMMCNSTMFFSIEYTP